MVFLKTDTGEFRELLVPSILSIGRGNSNDIRPQSQSVSKQHAQITLSYVPGTGKVEAWLEDLNSSYGTFAGETPLEIERVKGKIKLYFGFYIRFGHAPNYFQYVETIPPNAEVLRPEIIVSPSKELHKQVEENFRKQQQPSQANPVTGSQQQFNMQQQLQRPMSPIHTSFDQPSFGGANMGNSMNMGSGRYDQPTEYESHDFGNSNNNNNRSRTSSGRQSMNNSRSNMGYDSNEDDNPRNMQISVNYPTGGKHSPQHPVSIYIDPAGGEQGNEFRSSRGPRSGGRSSGAGDRYSTSPEHHTPERERNVSFSDEYNLNNYGAGPQNNARSQSLVPLDSSTGQSGRPGWLDEPYNNGTNDRVAFEESYGNQRPHSPPQSYNRSNAIQSQYQGTGAHAYAEKGPISSNSGTNSATKPAQKMKSVSDSISELNKLAKKAVGLQSGKLGKPSSNPEDGAMHSKYYQQQRMHNSGTLPKGILKTSKQVEFQAKVGDNGAIMDAILPSKTVLVRRSWPDELLCPTSELIANFVDLLLAQEPGTTNKEYALYKDIYVGKSKDKNPSVKPMPEGADLSRVPILANLKMNPVKCDLPVVLPDAVMSEAVAETILDSDSTATGLLGSTITELNNLMRQCLLGANIDSEAMQGAETSADFDHALQGVITSIIKHAIAQLMCAQQSNVIRALETAKGLDIRTNVGLLVQQAMDSLTRINSFMLGTYLQEETMMLRPENIYEIVALSLSAILNKLDACNVSIWGIGQRADEVTMEHVVNKSGGFLKASLSLELEELRKMKRESDLTPLVDRIRQQETNILERKILRFHKVFEIILGFNLRSAFWEWRNNARALKRHELALLDLTDRCATNVKRDFFKKWRVNYKKTHLFNKTLRRFGRVVCWKGHNQMRKYLQRWASLVDKSKQHSESGVEIARLRNELCNLKATLHDLTNQDEVAASLAAERALNRELSSMNLELRHSMQQMEEKLLEVAGAPSGKRKDLVYHYLTGKEEELAEARRENKFLHSELDHLRILAARRLQPAPKSRANPFPGPAPAAPAVNPNKMSLLRGPSQLPQGSSHNAGRHLAAYGPPEGAMNPGVSTQRAASAGAAQQTRYDPSRNKTISDRKDVAFMMSKDEAKIVILSEVRRLRESHSNLQESRNQLNYKMIEETNRNVQLTMATQSLQNRLTAMERSANALRELLKQKFGDTGVVHMMEALENLGAGSNALLEVPASSSASVTTVQLPAQLLHAQVASGESKYSYPETHSPQGNRTAVLGKTFAPGAYNTQSNKERVPGGAMSGVNGKYDTSGQEDEDPSQFYSKAIEKALYR